MRTIKETLHEKRKTTEYHIKQLQHEGQAPVATWMSVMSQSSTNSAILIWCIAAAVYERKHAAHLAG